MAARPRLRAPERRAVIEAAAARLFAERGYAGTKLDDVAAAGGVTKPVLYRHFASKKELHLALLARHRDELLGGVAERFDPETPIEAQLPEIIDAWFAYVEEHPYAWRMLFGDTTGDPEIQAFHRELHDSARSLTGAMIASQGRRSLPAEEVEPMAELIRSAVTGLALWWSEHPETPRSVVVGAVIRVLSALGEATP
jgi:AcrR family transcriptional regulator